MAAISGLVLGMRFPTTTPSFQNFSLTSTTHGVGWGVQADTATAITHIGFRYGARTGTPPTYVATLEGLSATTGFADGTDVGGGSPTAATFTPPADATWDGLFQWIALTNSYTPSRGETLVPTIRYSSGTVDASNNSSFTSHITNINAGSTFMFPAAHRLTSGSWARQSVLPVFGLRTASSRYGIPIEALWNTATASTVGHRQALKFTLPSGGGTTAQIKGMRFSGAIAGNTGKNPLAKLWSSSSALQSVTLDTEWSQLPTTSYVQYEFWFSDTSLTAINFGTAYYLGLEVADAVQGAVKLNGLQVNAADDLEAFPGGTSFLLSEYDGATWTDNTLVRPFVEAIVTDLTASGGGGMLIHPGMTGCFNG